MQDNCPDQWPLGPYYFRLFVNIKGGMIYLKYLFFWVIQISLYADEVNTKLVIDHSIFLMTNNSVFLGH